MALVAVLQLHVALQGIHQSDEVVHDAGHELLGVSLLGHGGVEGRAVEAYDAVVEAHVVDGLGGREEAGAHAVVDVAPPESYPEFLPSAGPRGVVAVPLVGEEHEEVALLQRCLGHGAAVKDALALGDV